MVVVEASVPAHPRPRPCAVTIRSLAGCGTVASTLDSDRRSHRPGLTPEASLVQVEESHEEPADPHRHPRLLRGARRIRFPVLRPARHRLRLVRRPRRPAGGRARRALGMAGGLHRDRVAARRAGTVGAPALGALLRADHRGDRAVRGSPRILPVPRDGGRPLDGDHAGPDPLVPGHRRRPGRVRPRRIDRGTGGRPRPCRRRRAGRPGRRRACSPRSRSRRPPRRLPPSRPSPLRSPSPPPRPSSPPPLRQRQRTATLRPRAIA